MRIRKWLFVAWMVIWLIPVYISAAVRSICGQYTFPEVCWEERWAHRGWYVAGLLGLKRNPL